MKVIAAVFCYELEFIQNCREFFCIGGGRESEVICMVLFAGSFLKGFLKMVNSVMSYYGEGPIKGDVIGSISWRSFVSLRLFGFYAVRKCD